MSVCVCVCGVCVRACVCVCVCVCQPDYLTGEHSVVTTSVWLESMHCFVDFVDPLGLLEGCQRVNEMSQKTDRLLSE